MRAVQTLKADQPDMTEPFAAERRRCRRYQLTEIVYVSWHREDGTKEHSTGMTTDISRDGISLSSSAELKVGMAINIELYLRSIREMSRLIHLHADGVVCRVQSLFNSGSHIAACVVFSDSHEQAFFASSVIQ
jgi:hypothetical protein